MAARTLHVLYHLDTTGRVPQMVLLARELLAHGYDVQVCSLTRSRQPATKLDGLDVPVIPIGRRWNLDPTAVGRLRRLIKRFAPDLIHAWQYPAGIYCQAAVPPATIPCIGQWPHSPTRRTPVGRAVERLFGPKIRQIVVPTERARQACLQAGWLPERVSVIPGAAIPTSVTTAQRRQLRQELRLPATARLIGAACPLVPGNRLKDLIWTADLLKVLYDDVYVLVLGDGPQRWRLQRYCRLVEIEDRVHLLGSRRDAHRLISHLDCFWLGGCDTGQADEVLTAMAAGVPVVASDSPAARDLIQPGETGILVPAGNRAALARQTKALLDDPAWAMRLGEAGRQRIAGRFSVAAMTQGYLALYRELLGHP